MRKNMGYYNEIEVDNAHIGVEVNEQGEVEVYYLMGDGEVSDRHYTCAIDHLIDDGIKFND